ncbi:MAG: DUF3302 domain-containing protein [Pirellulales bacterium]
MFLEYLALGLLLCVVTGVFYVFMYIHDIPYEMAEKRHHPQKDAIYWGCWLSLFTLHVLWPFIFLWAVSKPAKIELAGVGSTGDGNADGGHNSPGVNHARDSVAASEVKQLREQVAALQARLAALEKISKQAGASHD